MARVPVLARRLGRPPGDPAPKIGWLHPAVPVLAVSDRTALKTFDWWQLAQHPAWILDKESVLRLEFLDDLPSLPDELLVVGGGFGLGNRVKSAGRPVVAH